MYLLLHLFVGEFVFPNKRREERVEVGECLCAGNFALECVDKVHHLSQDGSQVLGGLARDFAGDAGEALSQEVFEIPPTAVGGNELEIVNVQIARLVSVAHFFGVDRVHPVLRADGTGDIVIESLKGIRHIGIFLDEPVEVADIFVDEVHCFDE